jgi:hypothetical protein
MPKAPSRLASHAVILNEVKNLFQSGSLEARGGSSIQR